MNFEAAVKQVTSTVRSTLYLASTVILTVLIALFFASLLVEIPFSDIVVTFLLSSLGTPQSFLHVVQRATPLMIATVGMMVAFKSGVWNVGGEGQILLGVIASTGICLYGSLPPCVLVAGAFVLSFVISGLFAALAGWLKSKWQVHEIPVTMMQTFIVTAVLQYLINDPWNWGQGVYPRTALIPPQTRLPFLIYPVNTILLMGLSIIGSIYLLFKKTVLGYELVAMGSNPDAAFIAGVNTPRLLVLSMTLSGGICGLAGAGLVVGEYFRAQSGISGNYGFYAIIAALMAENQVAAAPFAAGLLALLFQGSLGVTALGIPHQLSHVIVGLSFILVLIAKRLARTEVGDQSV